MATRTHHRPTAHRRGDRLYQHSLCRPSRPSPLQPTPAAARVEDEPSGSTAKRRKKSTLTPIYRDWFIDMSHQWRTERRWSMQQCLCQVWRLCPGMFDGTNPNTPGRWKRSAPRAAPLSRKTLLRQHAPAVNIDETSHRLLPVHQTGWGRSTPRCLPARSLQACSGCPGRASNGPRTRAHELHCR